MKNIIKSLLFAVPFFMMASCDEKGVDYIPAEPVDAANPGVEFSTSNATSCEVDPASPTIDLVLTRKASSAAGTYNLQMVKNEENAFSAPSSVSFEAGETEATIQVSVSANATQGVPLTFSIAVADDAINPYTTGFKELEVAATVIKWEPVGSGRGYWVGNIVNALFGVDALPLAVDVQMTTLPNETRYRFNNPYADPRCGSSNDGYGYYGYPYNDPGDLIEGDKYITITVDSKNVAKVQRCMMGMDWGYGAMSFFHINPTLSTNAAYGWGKVYGPQAEDGVGVIYFPAKSIAFRMADYNGDSGSVCGACYLALSAADLEAMMEE